MHTDKNNSSTPDKSLTVANSSGVAALPDPLWPAEVIPTHLSPMDRRDPEVKEAWGEIGIDLSVVFVPLCLLTALMEGTKIGRHIMDLLMAKLGLDDDDYDD